jgi:haloacetate dehalogenase
LFEQFEELSVRRGDVGLFTRAGGAGRPVVLLHGYPQSQVMWSAIADDLTRDRSVVLIDLRGYGASGAPPPAVDDANYSKREMALDVVQVMQKLGHTAFDVVGHDRGGRVAHRLCLDHPERVRSVAVLDIVPTLHMFESVDRTMAEEYFHWFFLTRPGGLPERLLGADPDAWIRSRFSGRHAGGTQIAAEALASYEAAFRRPEVVAATCADYRAAATVDLEHTREDRAAGRRVSAPLLALWGATSYVGRSFEVSAVWSSYAGEVTGVAVDADHYLAEENPLATIGALRDFWAGQA